MRGGTGGVEEGGILGELFGGFEGIGDDEPDGGGVAAKESGKHGATGGRAHAGVFGARWEVRGGSWLRHEIGMARRAGIAGKATMRRGSRLGGRLLGDGGY